LGNCTQRTKLHKSSLTSTTKTKGRNKGDKRAREKITHDSVLKTIPPKEKKKLNEEFWSEHNEKTR